MNFNEILRKNVTNYNIKIHNNPRPDPFLRKPNSGETTRTDLVLCLDP